MSFLRKFRGLSSTDWRTLISASWMFVRVEAGLRFLPLQAVLAWAQHNRRAKSQGSPERIAWLVAVAARWSVLRPTCLRRSLVLCALLARQGFAPRMVLGTDTSADGFRAHAWVELDGKVLAGEGDYREVARFEFLKSGEQTA